MIVVAEVEDRELTYEEAEAAGFDGTGCDGDADFPYTLAMLRRREHYPVVDAAPAYSTNDTCVCGVAYLDPIHDVNDFVGDVLRGDGVTFLE